MQIYHLLENPKKNPIALTIGNFDGVHIGHQAILKAVIENANALNLAPAAMTFSPHARHLFHAIDNYLITTEKDKAQQIEQIGIEHLWQIPFDQPFASLSAEAFVDKLINTLHAKWLLVGDDFRFGFRGSGDYDYLKRLCEKANIPVIQSPTVNWQHERVSSSRIRAAIQAANFELVASLLGRPLAYRERVVEGRQLGRTLSYPTANLSFSHQLLLPQGVFAVWVSIDDEETRHPAICNIGTKPTINGHQRLVEIHLLDFEDVLYQKQLTFYPVKKIRNEQKFDSLDELKIQIQKDEAVARTFFS